jgi:tetratricopeptide (TPR) repeat protein
MSKYSPFIGSRPFDAADEAIFHGRTDETTALSTLWRDHRLTILDGPAGVGKTSLLRAGVIPKIGSQVLPIGRLAFLADFPLASLPDLNPFTFALLASWYPDESPSRISGSSICALLRRNSLAVGDHKPSPLLAAIDQTDLLFSGTDQRDGHRRRFIDELIEAAVSRTDLHLLITVRTENLEELRGLLIGAGFAARAAARFSLRPFGSAAACQAVSGSLDNTDHPLATNAQRLVEELGSGETGIDPALLQIVCSRLWDEFPLGDRCEMEHLPRVVDQILGDHCVRALATVAAQYGEWPSVLTSWFRRSFGRRHGSTGVLAGRYATRGRPNAIMRALEDVRLLRADQHSGRRRYHLRQSRLRPVVRRLDPDATASAQQNPPRLDAAEAAFTAGELDLAWHHAKAVAGETTVDARLPAAAECLLGSIAYDQGRTESAAEHYETAIRMFGALGDTTHVGMLLAAVGRLKIGDGTTEAVNRLRAALTQLPGDVFVKTALAQALWYAGRTQAAIAVLDDALSKDGGIPEALRLRGELLADLDKAEPALRDLDRVNYGNRPSSRAARALAKKTYEGVGPAATEELELVKDAHDSGPVLLRVARVLRLEGDADTAAGLAERAVRAQRPPLPQHLHKEAERLMTR